YGWYITELSALFLAMGIVSGIAMGSGGNTIAKEFIAGAKDILTAALIVGLAGGIIQVLSEGKIMDTILYSLSNSMQGTGKGGTVSIMYLIQTVINIFIPSGSAKAALTMPIMAPFSDVIGLSRQATVMAFQFGDGFTNMITPTSAVLMGALGIAKIPYEIWVKWFWKILLVFMMIGLILLMPTVYMQLNGF
ncbi:MAG: TIGR00366 family protein, partial [Bacteroidales bacterium]|nr:TIGR00366 family protein [Bacteroidales bacterium]